MCLQELPQDPRWPCRVPSPAGMGQSSSSGRPVTSTGTAPREKMRASCAVSRWGLSPPASAQTMPISPSGPHHPGIRIWTTSITSSANCVSSQWQLSKATQSSRDRAKICVPERACKLRTKTGLVSYALSILMHREIIQAKAQL